MIDLPKAAWQWKKLDREGEVQPQYPQYPPMALVNVHLHKVTPSFDLLICAVCKLGDF